jgi:hypothetical protein
VFLRVLATAVSCRGFLLLGGARWVVADDVEAIGLHIRGRVGVEAAYEGRRRGRTFLLRDAGARMSPTTSG